MAFPNIIAFGGINIALDVDDRVAGMLRTLYPESRWPFRDRRHSEGLQGSTLKTNRDPWLESPYPLDPVPGINEVVIPTGASRYGKALFLVDGQSYFDFVSKGYVWGYPPSEGLTGNEQIFDRLIMNYGDNYFIWPMTALNPVRVGREFEEVIDPEADADFSLWLLPLVDARYFLQRKLRKIEFTEGVDMSWSELIEKFSEQVGPDVRVTGPVDYESSFNPVEIGSEYLVPDRDTFSSQGINLGHAIDAAALSLGMRVVPVPLGDKIALRFQTADYARNSLFGSYFGGKKWSADIEKFPRDLQAGGIYPRAPKPGALDLVSPVLRNYYVCEGHQVTSIEFEDSENEKERVTVFSTLYAQYLDEYITGESSSQLYNLANKLRDDLDEWIKWSHNGTFAGVPMVDLTGYDDYLSIGFRGGLTLNTQIRPLPHDFYPRIQLSQAPAFFRHLDDGIICRLLGDVTACDPETLRLGYGQARPLLPSPSGYLEERKRSDDSEIEIKIWNGSFEPLIHDDSEGALPQIVQCKKINCLPVIDVEYCPPE